MNTSTGNSKDSEEPPLESLLKRESKKEDLSSKVVDIEKSEKGGNRDTKSSEYPHNNWNVYIVYRVAEPEIKGVRVVFVDDILESSLEDEDPFDYLVEAVKSSARFVSYAKA
jgi:hypothetical protein